MTGLCSEMGGLDHKKARKIVRFGLACVGVIDYDPLGSGMYIP